jgi:hypothetical protein|tara:strand:+ start:3245 stop:3751 length:507 start_codon:yes stop_codon:yes gene_type:complete
MNFFKIITLITSFIFIHLNVFADSHDNAQNIVEKAKEINQKVKKEQAIKKLNAEAGEEEPLPLNDPFVGDGSLGGGSGIKILADSDDEKRKLSLFNFKLVGVMEGQNESYASLIDENGEIMTLSLFEELSPGIKLLSINSKEVVFERDENSVVVINFKNQITERDNNL